MKKAKLLLMLALVLPMIAWGQNGVMITEEGDYTWKYISPSNVPDFDAQGKAWYEVGYDDSSWSTVVTSRLQDLPEELIYKSGYVRVPFNLTEVKENGYYYFYSEGAINADIYVNGNYLGCVYTYDEYVHIPQAALKTGENILALHGAFDDPRFLGIVYNTAFLDKNGVVLENFQATDVTQLSNAIYMDAIETYAGKELEVQIKLKNAIDIASYQFNMLLPYGVEVKDATATLINDRHDEHTLSEGTIWVGDSHMLGKHYAVISGTGGQISGNDGAVISLKLGISSNRDAGVFPIKFTNVVFAKPDGSRIGVPTVYVPITILEVKGDANNNQVVTIADVVTIVSYIIGAEPDSFLRSAADVNNDGVIDISDAQAVVNIVLGRNSRQAPSDFADPQ